LAELSLPGRVHVGTTPGPVSRLSTGHESLDTVLGGGVPRGRISELVGPLSSGKTSLLLTWLTAATRRGEFTAWVDLADALQPDSVAGADVDLRRLLWVRPCSVREGMRCTELLLQAGGFSLIVLDVGTHLAQPLRSHLWPRLLRAAEQSHTALVVLAPCRLAGSFAALSLRAHSRRALWQRGLWPLFEGFEASLSTERNQLGAPGRSVALLVGQAAAPAY